MQSDRITTRTRTLTDQVSRRRLMTRIVGAGVIAGAAGIVGLSPRQSMAQDATPVAVEGPSVVGSWIVAVGFTTDQQRMILPNLVTYSSDGTVLVSAPPLLPELPGAAPGQQDNFSSGHGAWASNPDGSIAVRFAFIVSDTDGSIASINTVNQTLLVDPDGNSYTGTFALDIADAAGTVRASSGGTLEGQRITATFTDPITIPGGTVEGT